MQIAIKLGRNKSTVYRVIKNNKDSNNDFDSYLMYQKIKERRLNSSKPRSILPNSLLEKYMIEKIEDYWSPEQIASTWSDINK